MIGGAVVSRRAAAAQRLFMTTVACQPEGDTRFPVWDERQWTQTFHETRRPDAKCYAMTFRIMDKVPVPH